MSASFAKLRGLLLSPDNSSARQALDQVTVCRISVLGDVAMLAANLVGPSGKVVGLERDPHSIARARSRVVEAGLHNVRLMQSDVNQIAEGRPLDATLGRFILQFLPDPVAVLRSLSALVRPGGILVFQEVSYAPFLLLSAHLPLWSAAAALLHEAIGRSGANTEIGLALQRIFQEAGAACTNHAYGYTARQRSRF